MGEPADIRASPADLSVAGIDMPVQPPTADLTHRQEAITSLLRLPRGLPGQPAVAPGSDLWLLTSTIIRHCEWRPQLSYLVAGPRSSRDHPIRCSVSRYSQRVPGTRPLPLMRTAIPAFASLASLSSKSATSNSRW